MPKTHASPHRHPGKDDPDDEPDSLPVEPDEGPVPAVIPQDPEQQRVVQPVNWSPPTRSPRPRRVGA